MPPILYEDDDVIVVDKPAGLIVHGDGKSPERSLADMIFDTYPSMRTVGEPMTLHGKEVLRPGIVHRLDKDTSGAMILAKHESAFLFLKNAFQNHEVEKTYHAFLYGSMKEDKGVIEVSIGRSGGDIRRWATGKSARGELREAVTKFEVLYRMGVEEKKGSTEEGTYTYVVARPKTGRTHQLRVHFKHMNHAIVADNLYAPGKTNTLGFARLALHARSLTLALPSGKTVTVEAPFPADFKTAIELAEKGIPC